VTVELAHRCSLSSPASLRAPCPRCGFDGRGLAPADAAAAVRSFPRRYRERLEAAADAGADESRLREPTDGSSWSALDHVAHVVDSLRCADERLERILVLEDPTLDDIDVTSEAPADASVDDLLAQLAAGAEQLAGHIDRAPTDAWLRTGELDGWPVLALDVARLAVHEGIHHLRALDDALP
jgi:hypothetical protein